MRDFANGYLIGEILAQYYPQDISKPLLDPGVGAGAKKNNWTILDRVFTKYGIPVTRVLYNEVINQDPKSTAIVLSLIYSHVVNKYKTSIELQATGYRRSDSSLSDLNPPTEFTNFVSKIPRKMPTKEVAKESPSKAALAPTVQQLNTETEREDTSGKLMCTKILCSAIGISEPQISFYKHLFQPCIARDLLLQSVESNSFNKSLFDEQLTEKSRDFVIYASMIIPADINGFFDSFLPVLSSQTTITNAFYVVFKMLCFLGDTMVEFNPKFDIYKRFCQCRDYPLVMKLIALQSMDKIPYVAKIIASFLGKDLEDQQIVKLLLDYKKIIGADHSKALREVRPGGTGLDYLMFLSAFNGVTMAKFHSEMHQNTTFHLSECLTIINSYKAIGPRKSLLVLKDATQHQSVISSKELPSLEVTAVLHILSFIISQNVTLESKILSDVVLSALRIFYKIALHPFCPQRLKKSYSFLLLKLMDPRLDIHATIPSSLIHEIKSTLVTFMAKFNVLIMIAPILKINLDLCSPFAAALARLEDIFRNEVLFPVDREMAFTWDAPFLFDPQFKPLTESWFAYGVAFGLHQFVTPSLDTFSNGALDVLRSVLYMQHINKSKDNVDFIPVERIEFLYEQFYKVVIASLGVPDKLANAWEVLVLFMSLCQSKIIVEKFGYLLSTLIYTYTLDKHKCKKKLLSRLKHLIQFAYKKYEKHSLNLIDEDRMKEYKIEAKRVFRVLRTDFAIISAKS